MTRNGMIFGNQDTLTHNVSYVEVCLDRFKGEF